VSADTAALNGSAGRNTSHRLRVAQVDRLCEDAVAVTFEIPPELAETYAFEPGQSLTLKRTVTGEDERRSYSICARAGEPPRIGVREVAGGTFSTWLVNDVTAGDEIEVLPPSGRFVPDVQKGATHVLIAAGSGITPVLSVASSVLENPQSKVLLLYGNRRSNTVMFVDEIADLKDEFPSRLELVHVLSREPREAELLSGRLDAQRLRTLLPLLVSVSSVDHWWLCGPFGMVTDARDVLLEFGVNPLGIHKELFYVEEEPPDQATHEETDPDGPSSEVTLILDGRATTMDLLAGTTILEGGQRVRPDLPFACKGGVCGTCRARVVDGDVRMRRNYALEPSEIDQGFVLTCQSLAESDEVTVEYDA
jgi:ring-1,2-phenylacetyl-CoA epoxidase subunit PaaE